MTSISSTPTLIYRYSPRRPRAIRVRNTGTNTIYVGDSLVTTGTGTAVAAGATTVFSGFESVRVSPGIRFDSSNQAPRSISLQRSLQNGRQYSSGTHFTSLPQLGHLTVAGWPLAVFTKRVVG